MSAFVVALALARVVTLAEAIETARSSQPLLREARAGVQAARARADIQRAPLLPQLNGSAAYQRTTANFAPRPGQVPINIGMGAPVRDPLETFNYFNFGLSVSQLIWDFGGSTGRYQASRRQAEAEEHSERDTALQVEVNVRTAYFAARAQKALLHVAVETLANQERHHDQIAGFVRVGTRPEIDLAQARTERANARVQLIASENNYETAKATLNQAMGVETPTDYDVADETLPPVEGEERATNQQLDEALSGRPDLKALELSIRAEEASLRALKGAYGPSLSAGTGLSYAGVDIANLAWNANVSLTLTWGIFTGLATWSQVKEAKANLDALSAQRDILRQQVRLEVDRARLSVRAAKASFGAADEALLAARERLRLAEGRYSAGVGNVIEQGDAQLALTQAAAQRVQAEYNLASARAQLLRALGRR